MKPIHKFNGGRGATLCHKCNVIITEGHTDDLYCENHGGKPKWKYKLVRENDGLTKKGNTAFWIEWNKNGTGKKQHKEPAVGYSFILEPKYGTYLWLTTTITEIIELKENCIKFKTKNSIYTLTKN